jgi:primase-polymerase (primpol)-like protein
MNGSCETLVDAEAIPEALRSREQWVCWRVKERDGKDTKVPVIPDDGGFASATDEETWRSFEAAVDYATVGDADGIGFVFTEDDPFVGIDLDDCRDPDSGLPSEDAQDIVVTLESFTEVSPSGTGFHVIIEGDIPGDRSRKGSVEMYETARFFTMTGDRVEATPGTVQKRQAALAEVYEEYLAPDPDTTQAPKSTHKTVRDGARGSPTSRTKIGGEVDLSDEELLERAQSASNGEKFKRLWRGSTAGYESQSEADMALCCLLAFWTGGDRYRMDALFRQSGLLREKWDEVHYADGSTYGEKTIERAITRTSEFYDPDSSDSEQEHVTPDSAGGSGIRDGVSPNESHLAEKNRLLRERVEKLQTTLEQKQDRIQELEAKLSKLQS